MIINKIYIKKFGVLSDFTFIPAKGLNMIYCPNESGKTTLLDFIRYIFYGANQRKKNSGLTFREKYMPWNDFSMGGSLEFETNGIKYSIERSDGIKSADKLLKIFNLSCGEEVTGITDPGMEFIGIDEKNFFNTYFITDVHSISKDNSDGSLMSFLSGSDREHSSYSKIRKKVFNSYMAVSSSKRSSSEMKKILSDLDETETKMTEAYAEKQKLDEIVSDGEQLCNKISELETEKEKYITIKLLNKISDLKKQKADEEENLNSLKKELEKSDKSLFLLTDEEEKILSLNFSAYSTKTKLFSLIAIILFIISGVAGVISYKLNLRYFLLFTALFAFAGLYFTLKALRLYREKIRLSKKRNSLFDKINAKTYNEYVRRITENEALAKNADNTRSQIVFSEKRIAHIESEICDLENNIKDNNLACEKIVETNSFTNQDINVIISKIESDINNLQTKNEEMKYSFRRIEYLNEMILQLQNHHNRLLERKSFVEKQIKIYEYALLILDSAYESMKNDVVPAVSRIAFDYFSKVTGDGYDSLMITDTFSTSVSKNSSYHSSSFLSSGTQDILDFSLRLAVVKYMSDSDNASPLFMDDPFAASDDERSCKLLDLTKQCSADRQIFFTTCRSREGLYWNECADVNTVSFQKG